MASRVSPAEAQISRLLAQIYELEQGLASAGEAPALQARVKELMEGVQALREAAPAFAEQKVPQPALRYIDEGGHPDDYVRELAVAALRDNQVANGRVHAIQRFRDKILEEAQAAFPDAVAAYKSVAGGGGAAAAGGGGGAAAAPGGGGG